MWPQMTIYLRSGRNLFFLASRDVPSDTPVSSAPPVAIFLWTMVVGPKEYFVIESALLKSSVKIHAIQRMSALTTSVLGPCYRLQEAKTPSLVEKWWSFTPCLLYVPNSWMQLQAAIFLEMLVSLSTSVNCARYISKSPCKNVMPKLMQFISFLSKDRARSYVH